MYHAPPREDRNTLAAAPEATLGQIDVESELRAVQLATMEIEDIAYMVSLLAINAKIQAAHAGVAGAGFSVVASEINTLSQKTTQAAETATKSVSVLTRTLVSASRGEDLTQMAHRAAAADPIPPEPPQAAPPEDATPLPAPDRQVAEPAPCDTAEAGASDAEMTVPEPPVFPAADVDQGDICAPCEELKHETQESEISDLTPQVASGDLAPIEAEDKEHAVPCVVTPSMPAIVPPEIKPPNPEEQDDPHPVDPQLVRLAQTTADRIGAEFEAVLDAGAMTLDALFDEVYAPVRGSAPQQFTTAFTELGDAVLPAIIDPVLDCDPRVLYCAAVDRNGYLPTHNSRFSRPQRDDPAWNAAHSRHRQIYDDDLGLVAARNQAPVLCQPYLSDMGGGTHLSLLDVSAPIAVRGLHWGALRLGCRP